MNFETKMCATSQENEKGREVTFPLYAKICRRFSTANGQRIAAPVLPFPVLKQLIAFLESFVIETARPRVNVLGKEKIS